MKSFVLALAMFAASAMAEENGGGGDSPCQSTSNCEMEEYCYEGVCTPYLDQDDAPYDNIIVGGNDDAFFGWNDDDGVPIAKKAAKTAFMKLSPAEKLAVKKSIGASQAGGQSSDADDAHTVVAPLNATETVSVDDETAHESTAPASTTCVGNDDCPRDTDGNINRCIEGSCKSIGITSAKATATVSSLAAANTAVSRSSASEFATSFASDQPVYAFALVVAACTLLVGAALSARNRVRRSLYAEVTTKTEEAEVA